MKNLLIVDGHAAHRNSLKTVFDRSYDVSLAESPEAAWAILDSRKVDALIVDPLFPGAEGESLVRKIREVHPEIPVLIVSAATMDKALSVVLQAGTAGYLKKPYEVAEIRSAVQLALEAAQAGRNGELLRREIGREFPIHSVAGESAVFRRVLDSARKASASGEPVLISGEPGTGKEFLARLIHAWSPRSAEPFVVIREWGGGWELELFGGEEKKGAIELAESGTLFVDEPARVPEAARQFLGSAAKDGKYTREGHSCTFGARLIVATRHSGKGMESGISWPASFSSHLLVPPLRERLEDIPLLAYAILNRAQQDLGLPGKDIDPAAMDLFRKYSWPGNLRELRSVVDRLASVHRDEPSLSTDMLPPEISSPVAAAGGQGGKIDFTKTVDAFERDIIVDALTRCNGSIARTAEFLGTTRRILVYRIDKLKIRRAAV